MGPKAVACLKIANAPRRDEEWRELYLEAVAEFGEKVILKKFDDLDAKGYIESGVTSRTGWLTEKGWAALSQAIPGIERGKQPWEKRSTT